MRGAAFLILVLCLVGVALAEEVITYSGACDADAVCDLYPNAGYECKEECFTYSTGGGDCLQRWYDGDTLINCVIF